jgi:hypothetical protein
MWQKSTNTGSVSILHLEPIKQWLSMVTATPKATLQQFTWWNLGLLLQHLVLCHHVLGLFLLATG